MRKALELIPALSVTFCRSLALPVLEGRSIQFTEPDKGNKNRQFNHHTLDQNKKETNGQQLCGPESKQLDGLASRNSAGNELEQVTAC